MRKIAPLYLFVLVLCFVTLQSSQIDDELKYKLHDFNLRGKVKVARDEVNCNQPDTGSNSKIHDCTNTFDEQKFSLMVKKFLREVLLGGLKRIHHLS